MFLLFQGGIFSFHVVLVTKQYHLCVYFVWRTNIGLWQLRIFLRSLWNSWEHFEGGNSSKFLSNIMVICIYIFLIIYDTIMWCSHWHKHAYRRLYDILLFSYTHTNAPITPRAILAFRSSLQRCVNQSVSSVSVSRYCFESVGGKEGKVIRHIIMTRWDLFRIPTPNPTNTSSNMHPDRSEKHQFQFT